MKCSRILFIFIFIFVFVSQVVLGQENYVLPKTNTNFTNGDRASLLIESPLSDEELRKFENTKITDVIYVFKFIAGNGDREFEVIFSDPPKKPSEEKKPFTAKGINYNFDKERAGDRFVIFDSKYSPRFESQYFGTAIIFFLVFLLLILIYMIITRYSQLRSQVNFKKEEAKKLIESFETAKKREQLESLFKNRAAYKELVSFDEKNWEELLEKINKIQFKNTWSEDDLEQVVQAKREIGPLEIKNGI